jgi:signal transduction histidine kinase
MSCQDTEFKIIILDNGRGFDPMSSESNSATSAAGFCNGLGNMRQRLAELGGGCAVESRIGNGTTVQFVLSLNGSVE